MSRPMPHREREFRKAAVAGLRPLKQSRARRIRASSRALAQEIARRRRGETLVGLQRDVALHLAAATDTYCGLARCVESILQVPELDNAAVFLPNAKGGYTLAAHLGLSDTFVGQMLHVAPTSERVAYLKKGTPYYYSRSKPLSNREESEPLEAEGIRAVAAVPIRHKGGVIGCLAAGSRVQNSLPTMVREFLEGVAGQIGAAIARLQAEELLHVKDQAIDASVNGVAIGDFTGRLTYVNAAFLKMWGYPSVEECLGRTVFEFFADGDQVTFVLDELRRLRSSVGEATAVRKNGSRFPVEFATTAVADAGGRFHAMMGSFLDITCRKQAEEAMRNAERLRAETEKTLAAGRMAANVAHEINNPLAGITNCFRLVKQAIPPDHPHMKFAGLIEDELARIGRIVHQMHDLARTDREPVESVSVRRTADTVATMLAPMCRQYKVRIEADVEPDDLMLQLPRGLLSQVLYNLLVNAVEASPEESAVQLSAARRNGQTRITVRDCGPGVPAHAATELFEPFYTTKGGGKPGGLGLGLYLSKQLVCSVGGELSLAPTAERGATFQILLPARKQ